ncbi:MAG: LuxR C-terminal-related transcriptional regulator [Gemmatimonadaceae bacterium]|jgi:DNA-binding CsgD family transcriptional regulator|nr:LuxR C-terminal-related transcriptional regulator [Gemmatimonadaceae bacterium]
MHSSANKLTAAQRQAVLREIVAGKSNSQIARQFGLSRGTVWGYAARAARKAESHTAGALHNEAVEAISRARRTSRVAEGRRINVTREAGVTTIEAEDFVPMDAQSLAAYHGVNLDNVVVSERASVWDVMYRDADGRMVDKQRHSYRASFAPKAPDPSHNLAQALIDDIRRETVAASRNTKPVAAPRDTDPYVLRLRLRDMHFGALSWAMETGENFDLNIAKQIALAAVTKLLARANVMNVRGIVIETGDDLLHTDGDAPYTTAGTPQDADGRTTKTARVARVVINTIIAQCLEVAEWVEVIWIPGNHDWNSSLILANAIEAKWEENERVKVDIEPSARKYRLYGVTAVQFAHGHGIKPEQLVALFPHEAKDIWAQAIFYESSIGHLHAKARRDINGVYADVAPSSKPTDRWHFLHGYRHRRAIEVAVMHLEEGPVGTFAVNVGELQRAFESAAGAK